MWKEDPPPLFRKLDRAGFCSSLSSLRNCIAFGIPLKSMPLNFFVWFFSRLILKLLLKEHLGGSLIIFITGYRAWFFASFTSCGVASPEVSVEGSRVWFVAFPDITPFILFLIDDGAISYSWIYYYLIDNLWAIDYSITFSKLLSFRLSLELRSKFKEVAEDSILLIRSTLLLASILSLFRSSGLI